MTTARKYQSRPEIVEARQWNGSIEDAREIMEWIGDDYISLVEKEPGVRCMVLKAPGGVVVGEAQEFVIKYHDGSIGFVEPVQFAADFAPLIIASGGMPPLANKEKLQ